MFDRFIRLARARKALQAGRFEEALQLADDPMIRSDRRAAGVRDAARDALADRARRRLAAGDPAGAVRELQRVGQLAGPSAGKVADSLLVEAERQAAAAAQRRADAQRALDEARRLGERGQLESARARIAGLVVDEELQPALAMLRAFLDARSQQAAMHRGRVEEMLAAGRIDAAIAEGLAAAAVDTEAREPGSPRLIGAAAQQLVAEMSALSERGALLEALTNYRRRVQAVPGVAEVAAVSKAGARLADLLLARLREPDAEGDLALLQACTDAPVLPQDGERVRAAAAVLLRLPALRTASRLGELAEALQQLGDLLAAPELHRESERVRRQAEAAADAVREARALAAAGNLAAARAALVAVLQELPMHEEMRKELDAIDRGAQEREQRLVAARQMAKDGKLTAAYGLALADAVPGAAGDEARLFAQEVRARIDLVARGIDQVRTAMHGRTSGALAGLRHCQLRLEELAKVHADCLDLQALQGAVVAEIAGMEHAEAAAAAMAAGRSSDVTVAIAAMVEQRARLLQPDRLDARILEIGDQLVAAAEAALGAGRLGDVDRCLAGVAAAAPVRGTLAERADRLRGAADERRQRAEALAHAAAAALAARDLTAAEEHCEAARRLWSDGSVVRRTDEQLQALRMHEARIGRVEALAAEGDVAAAAAEVGDMPPTPALLRTRIFDMKQQLARAQGLEGAFLLRVDEGGEFLALRGDSLTVGNLRDGRADLPVLAAIAGCHARIVRSMSFHGGMQDTIVAEGGEVRVAGARVERHALRSGDRVHLGTALRFCYGMPSKRSLTASLELLGGFQVAGTDRILLFKDRGRDGRILLGPGADVHARVANAVGEVEIFANKSGRVFVRCEGGGTIDGRPFRGEHPIDAGSAIDAGGMRFVLLPWTRQA